VVGWLAAKLPQISSRRAEALVQAHGVEGLWALLDAGDAAPLCQTEGITPKRAQAIVDAYREHKGDRDRMVRMKGAGLTDAQAARVIEAWGDDAERRLFDNPYELIQFVDGFGWSRADEVAKKMGVPPDSPPRIAAGIMHAMREASSAGHCYCAQGKLVGIVAGKVCCISDEKAVLVSLDHLVEKGRLVRYGSRIYLPDIAASEEQLARSFAARCDGVLKCG
jgi:exodeoxyribonuclease V alpha subunit